MAIKIQTKQTSIPIVLGDIELSFDVSDDSVLTFRKEGAKIQKELENISISKDDDEALRQARSVLERGFSLFFGEGSFDKVYKISPSVIICLEYFTQIHEALEIELNKLGYSLTAQEKAQKYLQNKKK